MPRLANGPSGGENGVDHHYYGQVSDRAAIVELCATPASHIGLYQTNFGY